MLLIGKYSDYEDKPSATEVEFKRFLQFYRRINIMGTINNKKRLPVYGCEPSGPRSLLQSPPQGILTDRVSCGFQGIRGFNRQNCIGNLAAACKADFKIPVAFIGKSLLFKSILDITGLSHIRNPDLTSVFRSLKPDCFFGLMLLHGWYYNSTAFYDPRLVSRDFSQRAAQNPHMVHADRCYYRTFCVSDYICGIKFPSQPCFQNNHITALRLKIQESQSCLNFKSRGMLQPILFHTVCCVLYPGCKKRKLFFADAFSVHLDLFKIVEYDWWDISSHFAACTL